MMDAAFGVSIKTRHDRTELQSSFQHAANNDASWFFCSVIGLSFFETVVSRSWLDSSSQQGVLQQSLQPSTSVWFT